MYKIIILILLISLILYLYNKLYISENFINNKINFLSSNQLLDILKSNTSFYNTFTPNDLKSRNIKSINEYINNLNNATQNFDSYQKQKLSYCAKKADLQIKNLNLKWFDGIKASKIQWKFGLTNDEIYENGLPHTVNDIIILNDTLNYIDNINLISLLIHEKVHIYQKKYPVDVQKYLNEKNFKVVKIREISDNIRANPDIDNKIYKKNNIIYSAKYNKNPRSISDITYAKNNSQEFEHPFEAMAIDIQNLV